MNTCDGRRTGPCAYRLCFVFKELIVQDTYYTHPVAYAPVVFEVTGQIAREDCYLTSSGDIAEFSPADRAPGKPLPVASCWLVCPTGDAAGHEWVQMIARLAQIAECFDAETNTKHLFGTRSPTSAATAKGARLQVGRPIQGDSEVSYQCFIELTGELTV